MENARVADLVPAGFGYFERIQIRVSKSDLNQETDFLKLKTGSWSKQNQASVSESGIS